MATIQHPAHEHYKTTTVTAALRSTGLCAISLVDGATNGARFRSYVTGHLTRCCSPVTR